MEGDIRELEIMARRTDWGHWVELYGRQIIEGVGVGYVCSPTIETVPTENDTRVVEPFLRLNSTQAQRLIDSLWDCGIRPSEGSGSAGALAATQKHLEDMRKLVFEKG